MSAVLTLLRIYFLGTPLRRALGLGGLVCLLVAIAGLAAFPSWRLSTSTDASAWQALLVGLPFVSIILLFCSGSLMPLVLDRLLHGRSIELLPRARAALLASVLVVVAVLAAITGLVAVLAFAGIVPADAYPRIFWRTAAVAFVHYGVMYIAVWAVAKLGGAWLLAGALLVVVSVFLPERYIGAPNLPFDWTFYAGLAGWLLFALIVLGAVRPRGLALALRSASIRRRLASRYRPGRELALLLGTGRPWTIALGQAVPILVAAWVLPVASVWLFYLALFGAISGAIASYAAPRSRVLWLLSAWSRDVLFERVERTYWRHNAPALLVLLLLLLGIGAWRGIAAATLALGVPLLALSTIVSTYLGLMMTRGLGLRDALPAAGTMALIMAAALAAADPLTFGLAAALELALATAAFRFRGIARARWADMDWMLVRGAARARSVRA